MRLAAWLAKQMKDELPPGVDTSTAEAILLGAFKRLDTFEWSRPVHITFSELTRCSECERFSPPQDNYGCDECKSLFCDMCLGEHEDSHNPPQETDE